MQIQSAILALIFATGSLALLPIPVLGGGVNDLRLFDFAAYGEVNFPYIGQYEGTQPTNLSFTWDQTFELPASPASDYYEVTRVNSYSVNGDIVIDGQPYGAKDDLHYSPAPFADPALYQGTRYTAHFTTPMDLTGPITVHVYGSFTREFDGSNCCITSGNPLNADSFEQFLQIERFHADGTPDLFAPEPATSALLFIGLGCGMAMLAFRSKANADRRARP